MSADAAAVTTDLSSADILKRKQRTLWGDTWAQFRRHRLALLGLTVLTLIMLFVLVGPLVYTVDPEYADLTQMSLPPSAEHPFGTDDIGRDQLARNLYGGRISLAVGVSAMLVAISLGTAIGAIAGYFRPLDSILMRFTDMMLALPVLPLLLVIILLFRETLRAIFGPELGIFLLIVFVIGILGWMATARIVRSTVLSIKEKEFVEAAVNIGSGQRRILSRHILPNVLSPIIVSATLAVAAAILTESALSFLGLGFPPDVPTWGRLLFDGKDFMTFTPWVVIWPGLFISLSVLSINFIGDGLRDALDPRARH
jgi:peptide/nickel transport system permease protein